MLYVEKEVVLEEVVLEEEGVEVYFGSRKQRCGQTGLEKEGCCSTLLLAVLVLYTIYRAIYDWGGCSGFEEQLLLVLEACPPISYCFGSRS